MPIAQIDTLIEVLVNNQRTQVPPGMTVAALLLNLEGGTRRSVSGEPRTPLCGMGTCFECQTTINGRLHQRSCLVLCEDGMEIQTDG